MFNITLRSNYMNFSLAFRYMLAKIASEVVQYEIVVLTHALSGVGIQEEPVHSR